MNLAFTLTAVGVAIYLGPSNPLFAVASLLIIAGVHNLTKGLGR